jgi:hypothetical protein
MRNINIFMRITPAFLLNLTITNAGGDDKNDCYTSALTSGDYIELVDANLHLIDLLYSLRLSLIVEFYEAFFCFQLLFFLSEMTRLNQGVENSPDG